MCLAKTRLRIQIVILCLTGTPLLVLTGSVFVLNMRIAYYVIAISQKV